MTRFYLPQTYANECELAEYVKRLARSSCQKVESYYGSGATSLKAEQPKAVDLACTRSFSLLRGGPGTGKTTTTRKIVESFDRAGMRGVILCPTGKAAKRAGEVINSPSQARLSNPPQCLTCHAGLGWTPQGFSHNKENPLDVDYVGIDEASMLGLTIANATLSAINPKRTRLFMVGDTNQLPSVDPGNVMHDIVMSGIAPETNLQVLFRQGKDSGIAYNADRMMKGEKLSKFDPRNGEKFEDFFFVNTETPDVSYEKILDYVCNKVEQKGFDKVKDVQVLSPGKKGGCGTNKLNDALHEALNPGARNAEKWRGFARGDKIINRQNNWSLGIVNGDVGTVLDVGKNGIRVDFGPGSGKDESGKVSIGNNDRVSLHFAYAFTVHSSQGSEFPCVIIPVHRTHTRLLYRNMLYTGITRAKKMVILLGEPQALVRCINNTVVDKRQTGLQLRLAA